MKKLMIVAVVALAASFVNAATCNWSASSFGTYNNSASENIAFNWAVLDLGTAPVDVSKITYDGTTAKINGAAVSAIDFGTADGWGVVFGGEDKYTIGDYYTLVIYDQTNKRYGVGAIVLGEKDMTPGATGLTAIVFDNAIEINVDGFPTENGIVATETVPEPTSGLLLLLGMAGLALRRRRA